MSRPPEDNHEHALAMAVDDLRGKIERARLYLLHALDQIEIGEVGRELDYNLRAGALYFKSALQTFKDMKDSGGGS